MSVQVWHLKAQDPLRRVTAISCIAVQLPKQPFQTCLEISANMSLSSPDYPRVDSIPTPATCYMWAVDLCSCYSHLALSLVQLPENPCRVFGRRKKKIVSFAFLLKNEMLSNLLVFCILRE